jgi:uncharacterized protein (TIGR03000 family)
MYSLVLMSALVSGPDVPQFNGYFRDLFSFRGGCNGCYGSCDGRTSAGLASSCHGCSGEDRGFGWRVRSLFSFGGGSCNGCNGGCSGSRSASAGSCQGGGCYGTMARVSTGCTGCSGSAGCFGSGGMIYDSNPGLGGAYPVYPGPVYPGTIDPGLPSGPGVIDPPARQRAVPPEVDEMRYRSSLGEGNRATVTVRAPADAKVYAEGVALRLTDGERTFLTPPLPAGQRFDYTFRLEVRRDGEVVSRERKVAVRAGGSSVCDFTEMGSAKLPAPPAPIPNDVTASVGKMIPSAEPTSAKAPGLLPVNKTDVTQDRPTTLPPVSTSPERAKFSVRLPADAVLYIDGKRNDKTGQLREFVTPPLPQGKEFQYEVKVEVAGPHGYPQSATTTVSFRAGETVPALDFADLMKK